MRGGTVPLFRRQKTLAYRITVVYSVTQKEVVDEAGSCLSIIQRLQIQNTSKHPRLRERPYD